MKIIKILPFLFFCYILMFSPLSLATESIRLALTETPPLMSKEMENYGCESEIVTSAFKVVNIETHYLFIYPEGAFERTKSGENFDALVGWVWSKEREEFFYYSDPIFENPLVFFYLKSFSFNWESYDDLKGIPIGIVEKNYYGPEFHKAINDGILIVDEVSNNLLNFNKLLYKRIKLYPFNLLCGYYYIQKEYKPQEASLFIHHPKPLKVSVYHVLFSKAIKKNKSMVELFNKGLHQIKENGQYDELIKKYKFESK